MSQRAQPSRKRIEDYQSRINNRSTEEYQSRINTRANRPNSSRSNENQVQRNSMMQMNPQPREAREDARYNTTGKYDTRYEQYPSQPQARYGQEGQAYTPQVGQGAPAQQPQDKQQAERPRETYSAQEQPPRKRLPRRGDESRYREQLERRRRIRSERRNLNNGSRQQQNMEHSQTNRDSQRADYSTKERVDTRADSQSNMGRLRRLEDRQSYSNRTAYNRREMGKQADRRDRERRPEMRSMARLRDLRMRTGRSTRPNDQFGHERMNSRSYAYQGRVYESRLGRLKRLEQRRPKDKEELKTAEELDKEIDKQFNKDKDATVAKE